MRQHVIILLRGNGTTSVLAWGESASSWHSAMRRELTRLAHKFWARCKHYNLELGAQPLASAWQADTCLRQPSICPVAICGGTVSQQVNTLEASC